MSMRWLVPSAAARPRRLTSPTPCSATWSIAAESRRSRAPVRSWLVVMVTPWRFTVPCGTCTTRYRRTEDLHGTPAHRTARHHHRRPRHCLRTAARGRELAGMDADRVLGDRTPGRG